MTMRTLDIHATALALYSIETVFETIVPVQRMLTHDRKDRPSPFKSGKS